MRASTEDVEAPVWQRCGEVLAGTHSDVAVVPSHKNDRGHLETCDTVYQRRSIRPLALEHPLHRSSVLEAALPPQRAVAPRDRLVVEEKAVDRTLIPQAVREQANEASPPPKSDREGSLRD